MLHFIVDILCNTANAQCWRESEPIAQVLISRCSGVACNYSEDAIIGGIKLIGNIIKCISVCGTCTLYSAI
jgi:hypothetical protein